jgi:protein involved in polysaccharide export with SLBB domain
MMTHLVMLTALLAGSVVLPANGVWAQSDFKVGLADTQVPVSAGSANPEWSQKQREAAAAAEAALKQAPVAKKDGIAPNQLGPGDKIRLTVFGEEDLSGEFEIDNTGSLALPLVGEVKARGLTQRELEQAITKTLNAGYLVNPRVNVEVLNFRPFFILGEVQKPGSYPYVNDLTVINAVALGGGYTTRAKTGQVKVRRASNPNRDEEWVSEDKPVYPGDVIQVEERFF